MYIFIEEINTLHFGLKNLAHAMLKFFLKNSILLKKKHWFVVNNELARYISIGTNDSNVQLV